MDWLTSSSSSVHFGILAFFLVFLYIVRWWISPDVEEIRVSRNHFLLRALNWGTFGVVFFLRGLGVLGGQGGVGRLAILFLMLPEIAYQVTLSLPVAKGKLWKQTTD